MEPFIFPPIHLILELWRYADWQLLIYCADAL